VHAHAPAYSGKLSVEFSDLADSGDPQARFRGNVVIGQEGSASGGASFDRFVTASAIGLEMGMAMDEGWLRYDGDLVVTLRGVPDQEPLIVNRRDGHIIVFEFGSNS